MLDGGVEQQRRPGELLVVNECQLVVWAAHPRLDALLGLQPTQRAREVNLQGPRPWGSFL